MPLTPELTFDQGTLLLSGVKQRFIEHVFSKGVWVFDGRVGKFRCDALHYATVQASLHSHLTSRWVDSVPAWKRLDRLAELAVSSEQSLGTNTGSGNPTVNSSEPPVEISAETLTTAPPNKTEQLTKRKAVQLRADQLLAVEAWLASRRGCLVMPTGTGKTEVALKLIMSIASSTLIVAPALVLL